jgi:hypothetical protein
MGGLLGPQAHISPPHERLVRAPSGGEELGREGSTFGEERDQEESDCGREGSTSDEERDQEESDGDRHISGGAPPSLGVEADSLKKVGLL